MSTDRLLAFAAMSLLLIVIPGPSVIFVVGRALAQGRRAALTTVAGNTLGAYVLVIAVALGIGSLVERSVAIFMTLKLVGAAYLIYLGIKAIRQRRSLRAVFEEERGEAGRGSTLRTLWSLAASTARTWFARSPRRLAAVGGTGGLAMVGLGVTVAVTGRAE